MSKGPTMEDFFKAFDDAFYECVDTGKEFKLSISVGGRSVEIHIHETGKARKDFDEMIQKASEQARIMKKGVQ